MNEVIVKGKIPKVATIAGNKLERVLLLLLHPSNASLSGARQVVTIREVKPVAEASLDILNHLVHLRRHDLSGLLR
jgi:hypothetical protein